MSNKYKHVESKVKKYISDIKDKDELYRMNKHRKQQMNLMKGCVKEEHIESNKIHTSDNKENNNSQDLYQELLKKYNDAAEENKFLQIIGCDGVTEVTRVSLVSENDFTRTKLSFFDSTICSNDFTCTSPRNSQININHQAASGNPLICIEYNSPENTNKRSPRNSFGYICRSATKKVLRKFACKDKQDNCDNAADNTFNMQSINTMKRIYTPSVQHFGTCLTATNTSTPGNFQRKILHSAKKRVAFCDDNDADDQSVQARQMIQKLNEVKDFLATL